MRKSTFENLRFGHVGKRRFERLQNKLGYFRHHMTYCLLSTKVNLLPC